MVRTIRWDVFLSPFETQNSRELSRERFHIPFFLKKKQASTPLPKRQKHFPPILPKMNVDPRHKNNPKTKKRVSLSGTSMKPASIVPAPKSISGSVANRDDNLVLRGA